MSNIKWLKVSALIILVGIAIYLILRIFIFGYDPLKPLISYVSDNYLLFIEKLSNLFLSFIGDKVRFSNHIIVLNDIKLEGFVPHLLYIKTVIAGLTIIWLTKAIAGRKVLYSTILIFTDLLFNVIYLTSGAHLVHTENPDFRILSGPYISGFIILITTLLLWYRINKESILESLRKIKINRFLTDRKIISLFILVYIYFILFQFIFNLFDFYHWINILLLAAQKILTILGEKVVVEPYYLTGANGSVFVSQGCIGLKMMFLFASMVYLTKKENITCIIYILSGIMFLNLVNIIRLVLLFIKVQKYGENLTAMNIHDLYDYIVYAIIFVLWLVWFERFADIRLRKQKAKTEP